MELTPMMQQYMAVKESNPGTILFFRLGDFYEMFFDDARLAAKELGLTLTSRSKSQDEAPMCGVPYHAAETYINKLVKKGYKVAIAEQIGDPKAKGLTKREVIKIITPGTILAESALKGAQNNYIGLIYEKGDVLTLAGADVTTGECFAGMYEGSDRVELLFDELYRFMLSELLIVGAPSFAGELREYLSIHLPKCSLTEVSHISSAVEDRILEHFDVTSRPTRKELQEAVATLLDYLHSTVKTDLAHLNRLTYLDTSKNLVIDANTLRNLEITRNVRDGGKKGTLLDVLDFTKTPMGTRLLRKWLEYPLLDMLQINRRLDAVEELFRDFSKRNAVREGTEKVHDFERLLTRIEIGTANARDLIALKVSLQCLPQIRQALSKVQSDMLAASARSIGSFDELVNLLERSIIDSPGISLRDGGIIKSGYHAELDEYRRIAHDSKSMLQEIEEREREETGIKALKIGYNKVFGYYIEVRNTSTELVPDRYVRKQTLANAERYITQELKDFETKILGAQEKIVSIEYNLFVEVRDTIKEHLAQIQETARAVATIDTLASLSEAASSYHYVRPRMTTTGEIVIKDGRHPLVERILTRDIFVPNDTMLNHRDCEIMLITGPNMAGKSTYMRQTAILALMAQAGSFVPAREASISPLDRIFTRIGASDDLISGQSTFMVEMNEVAQILRHATKNSLVILDEIGRGTSTFDGMSIARSVIEYIETHIHAKTLFATHYHELTDLEDDKIKNFCVAVKERGTKVAFLRRIVAGAADKSYGIHVARLAGLPASVTKRAQEILTQLEADSLPAGHNEKVSAKDSRGRFDAMSIGSLFQSTINTRLSELDVMSMTPIEALNELYRLQEQARQEAGKG